MRQGRKQNTVYNPKLNGGKGRERKLCSMGEALASLFSEGTHSRQRSIAALWKNWQSVLGEDLAPLALPMGHKEQQIIIGAEDNMAMQELMLQTPEILERINAFIGEEAFAKVKVVLLLGQRPLNPERPQRIVTPLCPKLPPRPPGLGRLRGEMNPESFVTECYEAYLALFSRKNM